MSYLKKVFETPSLPEKDLEFFFSFFSVSHFNRHNFKQNFDFIISEYFWPTLRKNLIKHSKPRQMYQTSFFNNHKILQNISVNFLGKTCDFIALNFQSFQGESFVILKEKEKHCYKFMDFYKTICFHYKKFVLLKFTRAWKDL